MQHMDEQKLEAIRANVEDERGEGFLKHIFILLVAAPLALAANVGQALKTARPKGPKL